MRPRTLPSRSTELPVLVFLLSLLSLGSAAPVRGSTLVELSSSNVAFSLAGTKLNFGSTGLTTLCSNQLYFIKEIGETPLYDVFPSDAKTRFGRTRILIAIYQMTNPGSGCPYGVERQPSTGFRFLATGSAPWVAWNDTVLYKDTLQTGSLGIRHMKNIQARWVWSAYDSTRSWVRWTDTLDQASGTGHPLLTLTRSARIDSIVPVSAPPGAGLRRIALQIQFDSSGSWSMSFDGHPVTTAPAGEFPAGTNLRLDPRFRSSSTDPFLCRIWSGGRVMDSVFVRPAPPVGVPPRSYRPRPPATGRSFDAEGRTLAPATRTDLAPTYLIPTPGDPGD